MKQQWMTCLLAVVLTAPVYAQGNGVWTNPQDKALPVDFTIQGEYSADHIGVQVIALDKGMFQAVVYPGGLPGAGWDGKNKSILAGKLDDNKKTATFAAATGNRKYLAGPAEQFSATRKFPPVGQMNYSATTDGTSFKLMGKEETTLKKVERKSDTLMLKAPEGAVVLFDGTSKDAWNGGRLDETTKLLNTDGKDILTKQKFNNYHMHVEFMLPFKPSGRGQGRGNSGFYQVHHYEVQILDSFGLDGANNECGGVYTKAEPKVNMCAPPLMWQTYDVEFTNAVVENGKKVKNAVMTLKHNGVVIHDKLEINGKTGGSRNDPEGTPGPILLQGHGNPLQYRNIWVVEKK
ncbi:MAG: DUF1080 domain-containing protein [Zavarzinella sp.]